MAAQRVLPNGNYIPVNQSSGYDGDGAKVSDVSSGVTTYYLRSSVLAGAVIEEINNSGQKNVGYVYLGGQVIASQTHGFESDQVTWKHNSRTSLYDSYSNASAVGRTEFDSLGANVQLEQPPDPPPKGEGDIGGNFGGDLMGRFANFFNLAGGCTSSISDASCSSVISAQGYLDAQTQAFFGYQSYDLPGNANEMAQGEERYLSIMGSGYDPAFGRYWGTYSLTVNGTAVQTIKNPTLDQLASLNHLATAYLADSGSSDENTHDITTPSQVYIFGGAQYFVSPQNSPDKYIPDKYKKPFNAALTEAEKRLGKDDCAKLFGRSSADLIAMLQNTEYRYLTLPSGPKVNRDTGAASVVGAQTNSATSVIINDKGPFFNNRMFVPGKSGLQTFDFGSGLTGARFGALLLLHELGHQAGIFGADAGDDKLNREHTRRVQKACF